MIDIKMLFSNKFYSLHDEKKFKDQNINNEHIFIALTLHIQ